MVADPPDGKLRPAMRRAARTNSACLPNEKLRPRRLKGDRLQKAWKRERLIEKRFEDFDRQPETSVRVIVLAHRDPGCVGLEAPLADTASPQSCFSPTPHLLRAAL